ncbi:O-antigen ligase family protein [Massilia sp. DWR3-1-1]|uniref:O-antigen ligase family protein n=1 Tax=Massilia sp. DWR3-1-1 TaxID=2804559 RepID=UPI003CE7F17B
MNALTLITPQDDQAQRRLNAILGVQLQICVFMGLAGFGAADGADASSGGRQLIWGAMAALSIGYLVMVALAGREQRCSFGSWPIAALLVYVGASTFWSVAPAVTAKRTILLAIMILVCGVGVGRWNRDWQKDLFSKLLAKPLALLLGLSFLVTLIAPGRAFTDIGWRGITNHKNEAGQMAAVAILLLLYGTCHEKLGLKLRATLLVMVFGGLLMAKSTTGLLSLVFAVAFTEITMLRSSIRRLASWRIPLAIILLTSSALLFFAYLLNFLPSAAKMYSEIFNVLGKSETFTGRTAIWDLVLAESRFHNPWIGGGYGAFWVGRNSLSGYVLMGGGVLYPGQSHNGYVDIYNDLGFTGLGIMAILLMVALKNTLRVLSLNHPEGRLHSAILLMCIFLNLGESTFLRGTGLMGLIFLASLIRMDAIVRQDRRDARRVKESQLLL